MILMQRECPVDVGSENRIRIPADILSSHPYLTTGSRTVYIAFKSPGHVGLFDSKGYEEYSNSLSIIGDESDSLLDAQNKQVIDSIIMTMKTHTLESVKNRFTHALLKKRTVSSDGRLRLPNDERYSLGEKLTLVYSDEGIDVWDSKIYNDQLAQTKSNLSNSNTNETLKQRV